MTEDKKFKRIVRERMRTTGESFTQARAAVLEQRSRPRSGRSVDHMRSKEETTMSTEVTIEHARPTTGRTNTYHVDTLDGLYEVTAETYRHEYDAATGNARIVFYDGDQPVADFRDPGVVSLVGRVRKLERNSE
jgi:hypothetical protein